MTAPVVQLDPLLEPAQADAMLELCQRFGRYGTYGEEESEVRLGNLAQRHDSAIHFIRTGGRFGRREDLRMLATRTNYFRESYSYDSPLIHGIETLLHHEGLKQAAREVHGREVVVPNIVFANILVPGQELALHTDVPEFRGVNRKRYPQWLIVVMHHSGLFDRWRMPIATGITYFGPGEGGDLAFYPDGPDAPARTLAPRHNTAVVLDTDTVFHGVDRVPETQPLPPLEPGFELRFDEADGRWRLSSEAGELARYRWDEIRFSVSWKAYCYADEEERRVVEEHRDDLELDFVLGRLLDDLGRVRPSDDTELGKLLIDAYVRFPEVVSQPAA